MENKLEAYRRQFKDYKMTPQRRLILETLLENQDHHLSAEELYKLVHEKDKDVGLATIYRTLELLDELQIVQKLNFGDGRSRYELTQPHSDQHHHHHLVCLRCQQIYEVKEDLLHQLETLIEREHGFQIQDHRVSFFGYCRDCVQAQKKEGAAENER